MKPVSVLILLALMTAGPAVAQVPGNTELPPECRERDANPERCVINDGPPPPPIVRKKKPPPPPAAPKPPASQKSSGPKDGGTQR